MIDLDKHVAHWRRSALEDWKVAQELVSAGHTRHGLFFAHLALEKTLKAHITQLTGKVPPRIHNLPTLAAKTGLDIPEHYQALLANFDRYQLEGRYSSFTTPAPSAKKAKQNLRKVQECLQWLIEQFTIPS